MKKLTIILLSLGFILSTFAYADGIGIKGGVNLASISNVEAFPGLNLSRKTGLILGAFYRIDLNDSLAIQPEAYYSQKGIKATATISGQKLIGKDCLDYIEIPVLLKIKIPVKCKLTPSLYGGPYVAFLLSAKEKAELNGQSEEVDIKENVKGTDYGITLGASLDIDIGHSSLILDVRYSLGLLKISEDEGEPNNRNSALTMMLGYGF